MSDTAELPAADVPETELPAVALPAVALPVGLASMPPGVELARLLASVDRARVPSQELTELAAARARLLAWVQADLAADVWEAARGACAEPDTIVRCTDAPTLSRGAEVLGWALRCSTRYAHTLVERGRAWCERLPEVGAALACGLLDWARADAFADALAGVADDDTARAIAARLLPKAAEQTLGELRDALRYRIDKEDPASTRRRYDKAVAGRAAWLKANDDGTANITAARLPPHKAAQAFDRVDRIARAARTDGDVRNLDQLRADTVLDLLSGIPFQLHPSIDPIAAHADTAANLPDHPLRIPDWREHPPTGTPRRGWLALRDNDHPDSGDPGGGDPGGGDPGGGDAGWIRGPARSIQDRHPTCRRRTHHPEIRRR